MGYSDISNAEITAGKPVTTGLLAKYRDNLLQVETWVKNRLDDVVVPNWELRTSGAVSNLNDVWYNEDTGRWVFVGQNQEISWSDNDGIDWTAASVPGWAGGDDIYGVYYDGSALWCSCGDDTGNRGVASSADGDTWVIRDAKLGGNTAYGIVHDLSGTWVVVGAGGKISSSPDGVNWTAQTDALGDDLYGVAFGAGLFVAVGANGGLWTSPDGDDPWTSRTSGFGATNIHDVAYGDGIFVAVGAAAKFATSSDGITWTIGDTGIGAGNIVRGVSYDDGRWLATAGSGILISSPDGSTWTIRSTVHGTSTIRDIGRNGGSCWIAVGDGPTLSTSVHDPNRNVIP